MGAASSTPSSSPTPTPIRALSCPASDNSVHISSRQPYRIGCNTDFTGTDLGWSGGSSLLDCISRCETVNGCSATTYTPSGACYFKSADAKYRYSPNAQGAILNRLTNGQSLSSSSSTSRSSTTVTTTITTSTSSTTVTSTSSTSKTSTTQQTSSTLSSTLTTVTTSSTSTSTSSSATPSPSGRSLTLLALGDSITSGYIATGAHNSYRLALMNMIMNSTPMWNVDLSPAPGAMYQRVGAVGGVLSGNFTQNNCEGYPAMQIDYIRSEWTTNSVSYATTPDVILLLAGINDVVQNVTNDSTLRAVQRLGSFVDSLSTAYPLATVIVSQLTPTLIDGWQPQVNIFNKALPFVMQNRISAGKKVLIAPMYSALNAADIADWVHPTAEGYVKMAKVWYSVIQTAQGKGWLP